jgi:competence protein ComEC
MRSKDSCMAAFLDVGQGDSIVILLPEEGRAILVDCPKYRKGKVFKFLLDNQITDIPLAVLTHMHRDHAGHFVQLLENYRNNGGVLGTVAYVPSLLTNTAETSENRQLIVGLTRLGSSGIEVRFPLYPSFFWESCGVKVKSLHPNEFELTRAMGKLAPNEGSVVLQIEYKGHVVLLTGDLAGPGLETIAQRSTGPVDALQIPHHGGWDARLPVLLGSINPRFVVVSVGTVNDYDHPADDTLQALRATSARVACTQATTRCHPDLSKAKEEILRILPNASEYAQGTACPCAGTVFVEMSTAGVTMYPTPDVHDVVLGKMTSGQCRRELWA